MPNYNSTQVMDSVLPPKRSVSSCRKSSRMWALQDGTGSGVTPARRCGQARCADGMGSPGAATPARSSDVVPLTWLLLNWVDW